MCKKRYVRDLKREMRLGKGQRDVTFEAQKEKIIFETRIEMCRRDM